MAIKIRKIFIPRNIFSLTLIIATTLYFSACHFIPPKASTHPDPVFLITEFPPSAPYFAELIGDLHRVYPKVKAIDLIRTPPNNTLSQNAVILDQIALTLPDNSITVAILNTTIRPEHAPLLILTQKNKYYIVPDNSLITLVLEREHLKKAWRLNLPEHHSTHISNTYAHREIYATIAAKLSSGTPPDSLGTPTRDISKKYIDRPSAIAQTVTGKILHIDSYGNLITNIPRDFSPILVQDSMLRIDIDNKSISAPLVKDYADVPVGRFALVFNNQNLLELAVHQGSAASEFKNIAPGTTITILP
jgi:S-adenosylmethionine hydrolase